MKKLVVSFILSIFVFCVFYPTIYATENILINEVEENETEEILEKEEEEKTEDGFENVIVEENKIELEEQEQNEIEENILEEDNLNTIEPSETILPEDTLPMEEPVINEEVKSNLEEDVGLMCIDTPRSEESFTLPNTTEVNLSGWAVSNDAKSVVKLYVNGVYWTEIERSIERPDVNNAFPEYAETTEKAGYHFGVDISLFPEGRHNIKVEQVSRNGKVISTADVWIEVRQPNYTGAMCIDTPRSEESFTLPNTTEVNLSGWAVSNDANSVVKLYVNGVYWTEIERNIERPDVNNAFPEYAETTEKAGYHFGVDISLFPEGRHNIKVEQVSRNGKVISTADVWIEVRQPNYTGAMCIDTPRSGESFTLPNTTEVNLSGWAVSNDANSVVKLYVNGVYWTEIERNIERPDVNNAFPEYAGTTEKAGYHFGVDISLFPEGTHNIRVEQVSRYGKVISTADTVINVKTPDYPGLMCIDVPIQNKRYASGALTISGWAVTTSPDDYVSVYLDGVYQIGAERTAREDVVNIHGADFGLTSASRPGFYSEISTANLGEGVHTVKIVNYSRHHKRIQEAEVRFVISNTTTWGIDVSHHNGTINWDAVRNSGVNFAILKIGEYRESTGKIIKDDHFEEYYAACRARGIAVGGYFYSYAFNPEEAAHEAEACTNIINGKTFEMPIFFDIEDHLVTEAVDSGRTNVENLTNATITFCDILNARGYQSGVYSYRNFFYSYLNMSVLEKYHVWLAHYVPETDYTGKYDMWQYTSSGSLPGINGAVDLNWCFKRFY